VAGNGLSGGTITTTGTIALSTPVTVPNGGTGNSALTATAILTGNGTGPVVGSAATLTSLGAMTIPTTLAVQGTSALNSATVTTTLTVNGAATLAAGAAITGNATVSGQVNTGNAVNVTLASGGGSDFAAFWASVPAASDCFVHLQSSRTWGAGVKATGVYMIADYTAGAPRIQIDAAGACLNTTGTWAAFSDPRLKTDMAPYAAGLTEIELLEPITFRFNGEGPAPADDEGVTRYGLDAQATQAVMPELVGEHDGFLTLDTGPLIFALCNAVKELKAENTALSTRVAALEGAR
jgi:hypothetical protein